MVVKKGRGRAVNSAGRGWRMAGWLLACGRQDAVARLGPPIQSVVAVIGREGIQLMEMAQRELPE
jgi:hypothetical protein